MKKTDQDDSFVEAFKHLGVSDTAGYEADDEETAPAVSRRARSRLLVGEADGSFGRAQLTKHEEAHPNMAGALVVTELQTVDELLKNYPDTFPENQEFLASRGIQVKGEIDGTKLHEYKELSGKHFERIHFNFPHDRSQFQDQTLPKMIAGFFASARKVQNLNDEVHMALPKPPRRYPGDNYNEFYKGYVYDVYTKAAKNGYQFFKKRRFDAERFPGYQHRMTKHGVTVPVTESSREYIFKKTNKSFSQIIKEDCREGRAPSIGKFYGQKRLCIPEIATDDDSSSYDTDSPEQALQADF